IASDCIECQRVQNLPPRLVHPWEWPTTPWQRLHLDFAGPFMGSNFLIVVDAHSKCYRRTPHSTTCESPSLLLLNRQLRTRLDLIKPNMAQNVANKQETSIRNTNTHTFTANDKVAVKMFGNSKWKFGEILSQDSNSMYSVRVGDEVIRRNHNQLRPIKTSIPLDKPEPIELPQVQESSNGQVETPSEIVNAESGEASVPIENSSKDISTNITTSNISDTSNEQLTVKARRGRGPARSYGPPTRRSERLINQR
ncbi:hypothetical protein B4U79_07050, partial [Dinothrombium tinctorium]